MDQFPSMIGCEFYNMIGYFWESHKHFTLDFDCTIIVTLQMLRQVLFDLRAGNSNLAKSLSEKSNHAMYQDENSYRCLLSLQN